MVMIKVPVVVVPSCWCSDGVRSGTRGVGAQAGGAAMELAMDFLQELGIKAKNFGASSGIEWNATTDQGELDIVSPVDGKHIASVYLASEADYERLVAKGVAAFKLWRMVPAPKRTPRRPAGCLLAQRAEAGIGSWICASSALPVSAESFTASATSPSVSGAHNTSSSVDTGCTLFGRRDDHHRLASDGHLLNSPSS